MSPTDLLPRRHYYLAALLLLLFWNLNLRPIPSGDSLPTVLGAISLWLDGSFAVNRFEDMAIRFPQYFDWENGRVYGEYPRMQVVVASPFYAPLALLPGVRDWPPEQLLVVGRIIEKIAASLLTLLSVWLFYLLAREIASQRVAFWLAVALGAATPLTSTTAQALWSHTLEMPFLLAGALLTVRSREARYGLLLVVAAAISTGVAFMVRPTSGLMFAAIGIVLLLVRRRWQDVAVFASLGVAGLVVNAVVNPGKQAVAVGFSMVASPAFQADLSRALPGLLVSPGKGLFVYAPVLLFALPGAWLLMRQRSPRQAEVLVLAAVYALTLIAVVAKWKGWPGGYCYGPRLLVTAVPFLLLLTAPVWPLLRQRRRAQWLAGALVAFSLFVQYVGVYHYPRGHWDGRPSAAQRRSDRYFDWHDNPISRSFLAGPATEPYQILAAYLRGGADEARKVMAQQGVQVY